MSQQPNEEVGVRRATRSRHPQPGTAIPGAAQAQAARRTRYIENGVFVTAPEHPSLAESLEYAEQQPGRMALTLFPSPASADIAELAQAWNLHHLLVEDIERGGQRPKLERHGDVLFLVVRSARYVDETEDVEFFEFHVLVRPNAIAVICQDGRWIDGANEFHLPEHIVESMTRGDVAPYDLPRLLQLGPEAVLYRFLDAIIDGYVPVLRGIDVDKEQIESQVFDGDATVTERIYRLSQEVIELQHAVSSLAEVIDELTTDLARYRIPDPLRTYLHDVADHLARVETRVTVQRDALAQILNVNATLVSQRQNEDMKKISAWAAVLFTPSLIGAIYGMNFDNMYELNWQYGYPLSIALMLVLAVGLYFVFKRKNWL